MAKSEIDDKLLKKLKKIEKKNPHIYSIIRKKIIQITHIQNPGHYKNLKKPMQKYKRVHIFKSFVLIFYIKNNTIHFSDLLHHDQVYSKGI